jgi:hypothetical protein
MRHIKALALRKTLPEQGMPTLINAYVALYTYEYSAKAKECSCGFCLPSVPLLPSCFLVRVNKTLWIHGKADGDLCLETA